MMRLGVSNLAWTPEQAGDAYALLQRLGVRGLEIAPSLLFADLETPLHADAGHCQAARDEAGTHGLQLCSMQSALFGLSDARLFESPGERANFVRGMEEAIGLAGRLGIPTVVLGSPKNRIMPGTMSPEEAEQIWREAFTCLAAAAETAGTRIALEPNPDAYGTNFCTRLDETLSVAERVGHPAFGVNLDLGALLLNDELSGLRGVLDGRITRVFHAHVSTPYLKPVSPEAESIGSFVETLSMLGYEGWLSIEMVNVFSDVAAAIAECQNALARSEAGAG
ncbi:sugar phosphate isomerase/epimerase [Ruegeria sp. 2012CJ41-6]|uniref:Sugar phosphate isomerase/epimerase n=1 Tax=Ruegeria spongiae TaxID=2942209 RepID=A0ABT0Q653_9RHOB|nr:sugar phosphate isomerase/epimerase family protein [Ruegeria spongiae]MCL6285277.1 sugar phosphate isomerase/epimerase [Ruegeria spongiae]